MKYIRKVLGSYFIKGLWEFSRQNAGQRSVSIAQVVAPKHYLHGLELDLSGAKPRDVRIILRRLIRLADDSAPFDNGNSFLQAVSAIFGIDEGNDLRRMQVTKEQILPVLIRDPKLLTKVMQILPSYSAWTAAGAHRLMPVAVAVVNLFNGRNIFDPAAVEQLRETHLSFNYLTEIFPFYANPFNIPNSYMPELPTLILSEFAKNKHYKWLDVATAPKHNGSPTLNMLRRALVKSLTGVDFDFYGTDIAMPYFKIDDQGIARLSEYVDPATGNFRSQLTLNGVKYFYAGIPDYNALSPSFFRGEQFDFISACMALHHLKLEGEMASPMPLSTLNIIGQEGRAIDKKLILEICPSTQRVVDRLLRKLNPGGIFFVNTFFPGPDMHRHSDMFFMIRRTSENEFTLYDGFPIPFMPKEGLFLPSREWSWVNGEVEPHGFFLKSNAYINPGIRSVYPGKPAKFYERVQELFDCADRLVFHYQSWGKGVWGKAKDAAQALRAGKSLPEILEIYLGNVPADELIKGELLKAARFLVE